MKELQGMHCDSNGCHLTPYNISKEPVIKIKMFSDYSAHGAIQQMQCLTHSKINDGEKLVQRFKGGKTI